MHSISLLLTTVSHRVHTVIAAYQRIPLAAAAPIATGFDHAGAWLLASNNEPRTVTTQRRRRSSPENDRARQRHRAGRG